MDAEAPQALGIEVVEVDILDGIDPRRLQRRGTADDGEISSPQLAECCERCGPQAALADNEAHPVVLHERPRETLHARRGGGTDANRGVASRMLRRRRDLFHVGRGVDDSVPIKLEARRAAAIEHRDLGRVAYAVKRTLQRDSIVDPQRAGLRLGDRRRQRVMAHARALRIAGSRCRSIQ